MIVEWDRHLAQLRQRAADLGIIVQIDYQPVASEDPCWWNRDYVLLLARWNRRVNQAAWVRLLKYSRLHDLDFLHPDVLLHGSRRHTGGKVGVRVAFLRRTL